MFLKRLTTILTAAALSGGCLTLVPACAQEETPLRVMPLGDSITDGFTVTGGYRVPLWHMLDDAGLAGGIDFVGPNWGSDGIADPNHAGYSGYSIADIPNQRSGIYNFIDWLMEENPADVVLLQIGTNDILSSYELDSAGARLELLVDSILTYIPDGGMLYVSTIPYMDADVTTYTDAYTAEEMDAAVDAYNADVRAVVAKKAAEGKPIAQADINAVLTKADLGDGVHPSEEGYRKMAEYWYGVLTAYMDGDTPATTPTETDTTEETPTESDTAAPERRAGDVTCDGTVRLEDIVLLQKYLLGAEPLSQAAYDNADLNADGVVDVFDLSLLKREILSNLYTIQPVLPVTE